MPVSIPQLASYYTIPVVNITAPVWKVMPYGVFVSLSALDLNPNILNPNYPVMPNVNPTVAVVDSSSYNDALVLWMWGGPIFLLGMTLVYILGFGSIALFWASQVEKTHKPSKFDVVATAEKQLELIQEAAEVSVTNTTMTPAEKIEDTMNPLFKNKQIGVDLPETKPSPTLEWSKISYGFYSKHDDGDNIFFSNISGKAVPSVLTGVTFSSTKQINANVSPSSATSAFMNVLANQPMRAPVHGTISSLLSANERCGFVQTTGGNPSWIWGHLWTETAFESVKTAYLLSSNNIKRDNFNVDEFVKYIVNLCDLHVVANVGSTRKISGSSTISKNCI